MSPRFTIVQHFEGKDSAVKSIYERILKEAGKFGKVVEDPKKTSIHLNNKSAFLGVATQKSAIILTIKSVEPITHARVRKSEKMSARRYFQHVKVTSPEEVDALLISWLKHSYEFSG